MGGAMLVWISEIQENLYLPLNLAQPKTGLKNKTLKFKRKCKKGIKPNIHSHNNVYDFPLLHTLTKN